MQFKVKITVAFLLSFFINRNTFAQTDNTPYILRLLLGQPYNSNGKVPIYDAKHTYQIVLKDSSKLEADSKIWSDIVLHKTYILYINKKIPKSDPEHRERKIYPNETLNISRDGVDSRGYAATLTGIATDSCWMFKMISGAITVYSYLSEQNDMFNPSTIIAIQKNDGEIEPMTPKILQDMLSGDYNATKDFDEQKYIDAIKRYNRDMEKAEKK